MPRKRQIIQLAKPDLGSLTMILSKHETSAREQTRARILDLLHRQEQPQQIAKLLKVSLGTVYNVQNRYLQEGLEATLTDKPRSGKPAAIKPEEKARITALACSSPPSGHADWTLRLLADKAVELGFVERVSHTEVGRILKKTGFNRT